MYQYVIDINAAKEAEEAEEARILNRFPPDWALMILLMKKTPLCIGFQEVRSPT
jgi:hypothetical protein